MWIRAALVLSTVLLVNADVIPLPLAAPVASADTTSESDVEPGARCFSVKPRACPPIGETCRCRKIDNESAVCCHIISSFQLTESLGCEAIKVLNLTNLHIWNATLPNVENLTKKNLKSLSVTHSHLQSIGLSGGLSCLNVSNNDIAYLPNDTFLSLPDLEFLSLAGVNLTVLPLLETNLTLDLSGKLGFQCAVLLKYLQDNEHISFINTNITYCKSVSKFDWFTSQDDIPLSQIQRVQTVEEDCIPGCRCQSLWLDVVPGKVPIIPLQVDCSSMGLRALPETLPPNTISLIVSFNNITSLHPLGYDKSYRHVRYFIADSNQITSILTLEGSKFIDTFLVLSLKNNHIKSLPTYLLSNAFDRNDQPKQVHLANNGLSCNCSVAQTLKLWLLGNKKHLPDYDLIRCDNMEEKVIELDVNKVCVSSRDWTDYIYYIIAGEVGLLLLLVGKVSYDYWVFKTAGYLPWPASKMPKLPCDWVFE